MTKEPFTNITEMQKEEIRLLINAVETRAEEIAESINAKPSIFLTCAFIEKNEENEGDRNLVELGSISTSTEALEQHVVHSEMFKTANKAFMSYKVKQFFDEIGKAVKEDK